MKPDYAIVFNAIHKQFVRNGGLRAGPDPADSLGGMLRPRRMGVDPRVRRSAGWLHPRTPTIGGK